MFSFNPVDLWFQCDVCNDDTFPLTQDPLHCFSNIIWKKIRFCLVPFPEIGIAIEVCLCHVWRNCYDLDTVFSCFVKQAVWKTGRPRFCGTISTVVWIGLSCSTEERSMIYPAVFFKWRRSYLSEKENRSLQIRAPVFAYFLDNPVICEMFRHWRPRFFPYWGC